MNFTEPVIRLLCEKFKNYNCYIGERVRKKIKRGFLLQLELNFKIVPIEKAQIIIEENIIDFCALIVITNNTNKFPFTYEQRMINKMDNIVMFVRREAKLKLKNTYIDNNYYRINNNGNLYKVFITKVNEKKHLPITELFGKYKKKRLLIVGSGESYKRIDYKKIASDIMIMVINYNFEIRVDFQFYVDKEVARNLEVVLFNDNRKIIGLKKNLCVNADYFFEKGTMCQAVTHSGAYALQLAQKMGFKAIYLIGYDYCKNKNQKDYCYKKRKTNMYQGKRIKQYIGDFEKFEVQKNVYNLNRQSLLHKFKYLKPEEVCYA